MKKTAAISLVILAGIIFSYFKFFNDHPPENDVKKPNLLFIFTDQQSYDMIGLAGNDQIQTPNLDQLAHNGIYFSHAISNCPL